MCAFTSNEGRFARAISTITRELAHSALMHLIGPCREISVLLVCDQVRLKQGCSAAETGQNNDYYLHVLYLS